MTELKETIKNKITRGDFIVVAEILDEKPATLRARFRRNNIKTISVMDIYLKEKSKLKKKLKTILVK